MTQYFFMMSTDPTVDPRKCVVGLACAAQALDEGHEVGIFFASHSVRLLQTDFIDSIDVVTGMTQGACRALLDRVIAGATVACSTGSQEIVGITPDNASEYLVDPLGLIWSGPPGVISMSSDAEISLSF